MAAREHRRDLLRPDDKKRWKLDDLILGASHLARRTPSIASSRSTTSISKRPRRCASTCASRGWAKPRRAALPRQARDAGQGAGRGAAGARHSSTCSTTTAPRVLPARAAALDAQAAASGRRHRHPQDRRRARCGRSPTALGDERSYFCSRSSCLATSVTSIRSSRNARSLWRSEQYGTPPFDVSHSGGVFHDAPARSESPEAQTLCRQTPVLDALGLVRGVSHTEYIRGRAMGAGVSRDLGAVGGAHIAELIEAATASTCGPSGPRSRLPAAANARLPRCATITPA